MQLNLQRPLVFFDLETTGTNLETDRIVEICLIKVFPDGHEDEYTWRVNPTIHIPEGASKVHGIFDSDVVDKPTFKTLALEIWALMKDSDWAGYNSNRFDVPMLVNEFFRVGIKVNINDIRLIDVQNIFYKKEPRTLVAALRFYCNEELENAHSAMADTRATYNVLKAQLDRYANDGDVKNDVESLAEYTRLSKNVDLTGKFIYNDQNEIVFGFGTYKGRIVTEILQSQPGYYKWFLSKDFPQDAKDVLSRIYCQLKK